MRSISSGCYKGAGIELSQIVLGLMCPGGLSGGGESQNDLEQLPATAERIASRRRLAGNCQTCPDRQLPDLPAPATWAGIALLCPSNELFGEFGEKRVGLVRKFEFAHGFECETAVADNLSLGIGIHTQFAIEGLH